jgi:hypothetical protein
MMGIMKEQEQFWVDCLEAFPVCYMVPSPVPLSATRVKLHPIVWFAVAPEGQPASKAKSPFFNVQNVTGPGRLDGSFIRTMLF